MNWLFVAKYVAVLFAATLAAGVVVARIDERRKVSDAVRALTPESAESAGALAGVHVAEEVVRDIAEWISTEG